jgi:phospholipid/cholesterol/gamma-HCH transport system ATP-binding protein
MTPPLEIRDLRKSFGEQKVLDGVDLTVQHGETLAVLGRSGIGKSVLLKLIIGLQKPDAGSIQMEGQEITGLSSDQLNTIRKKVGFLFQQAALYDSMTVEENVAFPMRRHLQLPEADLKKRVHELLSQVGMEKHAQKLPSDLSGGMQKRAGLARALALDPEILLFDEPTAGLDPITAAEIGDLIVQLQKQHGMTSVVVTHDIHAARDFADRMALINDGRVLLEGTFEELQRSGDSFVQQFFRKAA